MCEHNGIYSICDIGDSKKEMNKKWDNYDYDYGCYNQNKWKMNIKVKNIIIIIYFFTIWHYITKSYSYSLKPGIPTHGPRAKYGPQKLLIWPVKPIIIIVTLAFFIHKNILYMLKNMNVLALESQ